MKYLIAVMVLCGVMFGASKINAPITGVISVEELKKEAKATPAVKETLPSVPADYKDKLKTLVIKLQMAGSQARDAQAAFQQAQQKLQALGEQLRTTQFEALKKLNLCQDEKNCGYQVNLTPEGELEISKTAMPPGKDLEKHEEKK